MSKRSPDDGDEATAEQDAERVAYLEVDLERMELQKRLELQLDLSISKLEDLQRKAAKDVAELILTEPEKAASGLLEKLPSDPPELFKETPLGLLKELISVTNKGRKAAEKKVQPRFEYPEPDTEAELTAIQQRSSQLTHVMQAVGELGLEGVDTQVQIAGLHEIGSRCEQLARDIGMRAVSEGRMTQRQLSQLIGVHELTVHRWVKALQQEQQQKQQEADQ